MKKYDVIIVGSGPAGLGAAKILKDNNISFCIIEKTKLPREKLCGGGLTNKSVRLLEKLHFDISKCQSNSIDNVNVCYGKKTRNIKLSNDIVMINRKEFDYSLLNQVINNNLFEKETVINIIENTLITDKDKYEYKYIIFADGVNGYSRNLISNRKFGMCVECNVKEKTSQTVLDFKAIKNGYGWIFPKKDHTTIGLGNVLNKRDNYIELITEFAKINNIKISRGDIKGFPIPVFSKKIYQQSVIDNNKILVGDAASLVDQISGEGIYYAMNSGKLAAESINEAIKNNLDLKSTYFNKTKSLYKSLKKRSFCSKLLYSKFSGLFIRLGLSKLFINRIKRVFG